MRMTSRALLVAALFSVVTGVGARRADAQLVPMGDAGVSMGHLHLTVKDAESHRKFWGALGGMPITNGQLQLIQFPGVFVMLRQAQPTGEMADSSVDRFGFKVKALQGSLSKWRAAGLTIEAGSKANEATLMAPDGVKVEIVEDKSIDVPVKMDTIHFNTASPAETQAWYVKTFGARASKRGQLIAADVPGVTLTFSQAAGTAVPTRGRSLDHIGFIIKDLEAFVKKLEAGGQKMDGPFRQLPNSKVTLAFLTDPWGTYVELNEHLAPE